MLFTEMYNNWIHTFPESISTMQNANRLTQDLNMGVGV